MQKRWFKVLAGIVFTAFIFTSLVEAQEDGQRRRREGGRQGEEGRGRRGRGQFGGGGNFGPGRGFDLLGLIRMEEVRKEIKLDKSQEAEVDKIADKLRGERGERGDRQSYRDLSEEERTKLREERTAAAKKRAEEAKKMLTGVLNEDQMKRLNEIRLQTMGVAALNDDEVAAKLGLSDEQLGKIEAVEEKNREEMREAFRGLRDGGDREAAMTKMREMRETAEKNVMAVLTKEQQEQFAAMKGAKFEMPRRGFGRGRGDREGGNRGRRNNDS